MMTTSLVWLVFGFRVAWPKGVAGPKVPWIGVQFWITGPCSSLAEIDDEKRVELLKEIVALSGNLLPRVAVRSLAGRVQWMAGLLSQLSPFAKIIWGALADHGQVGMQNLIYRRQVATALRWLRAFASNEGFPISRRIVSGEGLHVTMVFDASPFGGGGLFYIGHRFGVEVLNTTPFAWWSHAWGSEDEAIIEAKIGEAAGQARWEAYALLVCFVVWGPLLASARGKVAVVGDAEGVLHAYMRFKADCPKVNEIMMEIAVRIAPTGRDTCTFHLFSEKNADADALSRLAAGATWPPHWSWAWHAQGLC